MLLFVLSEFKVALINKIKKQKLVGSGARRLSRRFYFSALVVMTATSSGVHVDTVQVSWTKHSTLTMQEITVSCFKPMDNVFLTS